jgi:hypothetical protein
LTKVISKSVSFSYSSVNSNIQKPENLLNYYNSCFVSQDQPNQWLSVKFSTNKNFLSGYMLRSCQSGWCNLKSWKTEGSNDKLNWTLIDNQISRNLITKDFSEVDFPVQSKDPYSSYRFTQTGYDTYHSFCFQ